MIASHTSGTSEPNPKLEQSPDLSGSNLTWLRKYGFPRMKPGCLLLLGGSSVLHFRLRVAQSHARKDLLPSYWSQAAIVDRDENGDWILHEVSLDPPKGFGEVYKRNAVQTVELRRYADPRQWPNIALLDFHVFENVLREERLGGPETRTEEEIQAQAQLRFQEKIRTVCINRNLVDLPSLILTWLAFGWGVGNAPNPLFQEKGLPGSVFVQKVAGLAEQELSPGLSSQASCPEAIWQAAKWWHGFYSAVHTPAPPASTSAHSPGPVLESVEGTSPPRNKPAEDSSLDGAPAGIFRLRQVSAAVIEPR